MLIPGIIAIGVLLLIVIQDLRTRSIWWWLPLLLFISLIAYSWEGFDWKTCLANLAFIVGMMVFLTLYVTVRTGKLQHPFREHFGLGDLLFLLALTPLVPFPFFVYFFTAGTIFTLIAHLVAHLIRKQSTIPYAGYFALFTMAYLGVTESGCITFESVS